MATLTIITDEARSVDGAVDGGRVLIAPDDLTHAIGWQLEPEGLCRGDVCVPVRDRAALFAPAPESAPGAGDHEWVDVARIADALGRAAVVDADAGIVAIGHDAETRRRALDGLDAPNFTLPDLDGAPHQLDEWRGHKKLLVAFSTW